MNIDHLWGPLLGILGGLFGTYLSIKNTNGPRERAFMLRSAVVAWVAIFTFIGLGLALPDPYRLILAVAFFAVFLPAAIVYGNRKQKRIRQEESQNQQEQQSESNPQ